MNAEEYEKRRETLQGWEVNITSYRIGETYYCHVDNVSPGATIARTEAGSREDAVKAAVAKAAERLAATRVHR